MRIQLISGPRNISTALMYSFAQREDMTVVDEPFYAYYLKQTGLDHPGREAILDAQSIDSQEVIEKVIMGDYLTAHVFFKGMAKHMVDLDLSYCKETVNVFLIRDPERLIASYSKVIPHMKEVDIGLKASWDLYNKLNTSDNPAIVVNSDTFLKNPMEALELLCGQIEIFFDYAMLQWEKGPILEDGIWAPYWYKSVHESTGFIAKQSMDLVPRELIPLLKEVLPYYEKLNRYSIHSK